MSKLHSSSLKMPPTTHALSNTPIYNMIRFWGRKPHNVVREYIETYTDKGDVVLDPFAGCGVVAIESLKSMRRAIYNDLNQYSRFVAKVSGEPVEIKNLKKACELLSKNILEKEHPVYIKGNKKNIKFEWLYSTKCKICGGQARIVSVTFTKIYKLSKSKKIDFLKIKDIKIPVLLIRSKNKMYAIALEVYKIIAKYGTITHSGLAEKLDVDSRPEEVTRAINEILEGNNLIKIIGDSPINIEYECINKKCRVKRNDKEPDKEDIEKSNMINEMIPVYSYPRNKLAYDREKFYKQRPGTERVDKLFTKRNLIALSILKNEIENLKTKAKIRESLFLTFLAILEHVCKMERPNKKGWGVKTYWIAPIFLEQNVWHVYSNRLDTMINAKEEANNEINDFFIESNNPKNVIKGKANVCFLNLDAREIQLQDSSVDYIFTDPEYGDSIQYYELSLMGSSWVGFENDWKNEIVVNPKQGKTPEIYRDMLCEAFKEAYRILKPNKYMTVTFHNREIKYWNALMYAIQIAGFKYVTAVYQIPQREYTNWLNARNPGEMSGDVYVTFHKSEYKPTEELKDVDTTQVIQNIIIPEASEIILLHNGQATFNQLVRGITLKLISRGMMHHPNIRDINYEKIFNENFKRLGKAKIWRLKEQEKVSPVDFIPLDRRIEWIIFSVFNRKWLREKKRVTVSDILSAIFTTLKNAKTPENREILDILKLESIPKQDGGIPYWIPRDMKQMKLAFEAERIPLGRIKLMESLDHDRITRAIAELGKIFGFDIWIGEPETKKNPELKKYKTIERLELPFIDSVLLNRFKNIDVIFLQRKKIPISLIEVEHTSDIRSGLLRMANIFEAAEHLNVKTFTILPDKRVEKLKDILTEPSIKKLIGDRNVYYATYSLIAELLDELEYRKLRFSDFINICQVLSD